MDIESKQARQDVDRSISFSISARIIDADSREGIMGAVVELIGGGMGYRCSVGDPLCKWKSTSDQQGNVLLAGQAPLLARPPSVVITKKGYYIWNRRNRFEENDLWEKLKNGFVFELKKCDEGQRLQMINEPRCAN